MRIIQIVNFSSKIINIMVGSLNVQAILELTQESLKAKLGPYLLRSSGATRKNGFHAVG